MASRGRPGRRTLLSAKQNDKKNASEKTIKASCRSKDDEVETSPPTHSAERKTQKRSRGKPEPEVQLEDGKDDDIRRSSRRRSGKSALELLGISPRRPRTPKEKAPPSESGVGKEGKESETESQPCVPPAKEPPSQVSQQKTPNASTKTKLATNAEGGKGNVVSPVQSPGKRVTRQVAGAVGAAQVGGVQTELTPRARRKSLKDDAQESQNIVRVTDQPEPERPARPTRSSLVVETALKDKVTLMVTKGKKNPEEIPEKLPVPVPKTLSTESPKLPTKTGIKTTSNTEKTQIATPSKVTETLGVEKTSPKLAAGTSKSLSEIISMSSESQSSEKRTASVSEDEPQPKIQKLSDEKTPPEETNEKSSEAIQNPIVEEVNKEIPAPPAAQGEEASVPEQMEVEEAVVSVSTGESHEVPATGSHEVTQDPSSTENPMFVDTEVEVAEHVIPHETSHNAPEETDSSITKSQSDSNEKNPLPTATAKEAEVSVKTPTAKPKKTRRKIVKAVIITPSGEKREIKLDQGVSTVKALEQILAGSTDGSLEDVAQLAADVNKQIQASVASEDAPRGETVAKVPLPRVKKVAPASPKEPAKPDLTEPEEGEIVEAYEPHVGTSAEAQEEEEEGPVKRRDVVGNYKVVTAVNSQDKIAYEALAQLAQMNNGDDPITIELSDDSVVDIDWLTQQGLQVVVADSDDQRWHRQLVGVNDGPALAQLAGNKTRARPEKHLVASDDLQELINNLKPDDSMGNHVNIVMNGEVRQIKCKYCEQNINDRHEFRKHMNRHKDVEYKPWKCPICHYRAPVRAQIARHVNIHGELKPFVCKECGKGFNFKQKLLLHLKYHLDIRDRQCPHCDLAFHEHKTLKNHLKKIHKIDQIHPEMMKLTRIQKQTQQPNQSNSRDSSASPSNEDNVEREGSGVDPLTIKPKKQSLLYGTRKTFLYTQQYKMGLLPAADRNNVTVRPSTEENLDITVTDETAAAAAAAAERKRRRLVIPKITSTDQLEPVLQQYCRVTRGEDGMTARFFCELCEIEPFTSKTGFIHHLEQKHPDIRAWQCPECSYTCRMRSSLIVHMKLHTGIKDYPCELCGKAFAFKQKLKNHMKHHMNLREYQCHLCDKAFNEKNDLTKHIKKVHNSERDCVCTVCSKAFKDQVQLRRHMDGHSNTRYLCEHCNKLYRSRVSLAQHMKSHTCMFHCEICDKNFGSYSGFMAHKVMHDESYEGYECELCKKILHTKGSLTRHLAISHSNERPHACEECGKQFKTKKDLKNHHIVHKSDRQFACDVCDFTCKRAESLRVHMRRHSEVKPYQCGVCNKEYTQKHALETHLRHHTGKVEGSCPICGRDFFTRYQLETHIRRKHQVNLVPVTGEEMLTMEPAEKPVTVFMCEECNSVFMSQDSLAVHILAEHMKQGWLNGAPIPNAPAAAATSSAAEAEGIAPTAPHTQESLLLSPGGETLEESVIGNTVEVMTEGEEGVVVAPDPNHAVRTSEGGFDGQQTMETLVSISDPGSTKQRFVSLIHPVESRSAEVVVSSQAGGAGDPVATTSLEEDENSKETAAQTLNALYEQAPTQEAYVAITDPASNQEMLVAMPHSNFESLLAATEAEVQPDGSYTISTTGDDYITVNAAAAGMAGETFVTIASDALETSQALVTLSAGEPSQEHMNSCVAVAETIEIPIETESVTVLDNHE